MAMPVRTKRAIVLPADLIRAVYSLGLDNGALTIKDRVRGLAVCSTWRLALLNLPISLVVLRNSDWKFCQWASKTHPSIVELHLCARKLAEVAVSSLRRKDLQKLYWSDIATYIVTALPVPSVFPNLRSLEVDQAVYPSPWLARLGDLESLEHLRLAIWVPTQHLEGEAVTLPPFAGLTCHELKVCSDRASVELQLAGLPALAELHLNGSGGQAALLASTPAPRLRHLSCRLWQLSANFAMLPGLKMVCFAFSSGLHRVANFAAATALTCLQLRKWESYRLQSSALELLRSLPPLVKCLAFEGDWSEEVAALVGQQTGLAALVLSTWQGCYPEAPSERAPVWTGLRAFSWSAGGHHGDRLNLPEIQATFACPHMLHGLRQASRLEALQCYMETYTMEDMELLCSLPALRKLILAPYEKWEEEEGRANEEPHGRVVRGIARRALPGVYVEEVDVADRAEQLLEWALK